MTNSAQPSAPAATHQQPALPCICAGNWRQIVHEVEVLIGQPFLDAKGERFSFFGVVHGKDDYYYGMFSKEHGLRLLSCVGNLEGHGYRLAPDAPVELNHLA